MAINVVYFLSQVGQRAHLLAGGDGKDRQVIQVDVTPDLLERAEIHSDGSAWILGDDPAMVQDLALRGAIEAQIDALRKSVASWFAQPELGGSPDGAEIYFDRAKSKVLSLGSLPAAERQAVKREISARLARFEVEAEARRTRATENVHRLREHMVALAAPKHVGHKLIGEDAGAHGYRTLLCRCNKDVVSKIRVTPAQVMEAELALGADAKVADG